MNACLAGYGEHKLSSSLISQVHLPKVCLWGIWLYGAMTIKKNTRKSYTEEGVEMERMRTFYPGRGIQLLWDGPSMKVTNFEPANTFVRRKYRDGWDTGTL